MLKRMHRCDQRLRWRQDEFLQTKSFRWIIFYVRNARNTYLLLKYLSLKLTKIKVLPLPYVYITGNHQSGYIHILFLLLINSLDWIIRCNKYFVEKIIILLRRMIIESLNIFYKNITFSLLNLVNTRLS